MAGIYIHIPFCKQACHYCDFHFSTNTNRVEEVVSALIHEIDLQRDYLPNEAIETIYFGGGTPSLLTAIQLGSIIEKIQFEFAVSTDAEVTIEANPDDLSLSKLIELKKIGINRLSVGVQSFDEDTLRFLNRAHNSKTALESLHHAQKVGFDNISIDLIFAVPDRDQQKLADDLALLDKISPAHISTYALTIEQKTAFGNWLTKGKLTPVDESDSASQFELIMQVLHSHGYEHYEISNFAKPGAYSRHNTNYWRQVPYLGIGPSAHSYNFVSRQFNVKNNAQYIRNIKEGIIPSEVEVLTRENKINEFVFTSLRTMWGCDLEKLRNKYDFDLEKGHSDYLNRITGDGLATLDQNKILRLTNKGKLLADQITMELMI